MKCNSFRHVIKWFTLYSLFAFIIILIFNLIYFTLTFWYFISQNVVDHFLLNLALLTTIEFLVYIIFGLIIYSLFAILKIKGFLIIISMGLITLLIIDITSNSFLKVNFKNEFTIDYSYNDKEQEMKFTESELILLAKYQDTKFYEQTFKNNISNTLELNFEEEQTYLANFCSYTNSQIYLQNEKIEYICKVPMSIIEQEYFNPGGINLIWINSINSIDAKSKFKDIFDWFKLKDNLNQGLTILEASLKNMYPTTMNEDFRIVVPLIDFKDNGDIWLGQGVYPSVYYETLEQFIKVIFYYYLIEYINDPFAVDVITSTYYGDIFNRFLQTTKYDKRIFKEIFNMFMWSTNTNNSATSDFLKSEYTLKDIDQYFSKYISSNIYLKIINFSNLNQSYFRNINKHIEQQNTLNFANIFNYHNYYLKLLIGQYQILPFEVISKNSSFSDFYVFESRLNIKKIGLNIEQLDGTNQKEKQLLYWFIIIFSLIIILLLCLFYICIKIEFREQLHSKTFPIIF